MGMRELTTGPFDINEGPIAPFVVQTVEGLIK